MFREGAMSRDRLLGGTRHQVALTNSFRESYNARSRRCNVHYKECPTITAPSRVSTIAVDARGGCSAFATNNTAPSRVSTVAVDTRGGCSAFATITGGDGQHP